ncbi:MAG: GxxExxY protein [Phycisphaerae bacterium]|nr:GxxExxY protein [Phycisphaerae bacterium]
MHNDHNRYGHAQDRRYGGPGVPRNDGYSNEGGYGDSRGERGPRQDRRGTPLADLDPALTDVSRRVIGCAIEVHKALGPGFGESVYQRALEMELGRAGVRFRARHPVTVSYRGERVGELTADLYVDERFIVELMAEQREIGGTERAALRAELRAADLELGLIINFAERRLKDGLVRVLNPDKLQAMQSAGSGGGTQDDMGAIDAGDDLSSRPPQAGVYDPDRGR